MYKLDLTPLHHIRYAFSEPFAGTTACVFQLQRNASPLSLGPGRLLNSTAEVHTSATATATDFRFLGVLEKVH